MAETNPRLIIRESQMKTFQWIAIWLCVAMTALDGFDVLSVSFVGPELRRIWGISQTEVAALVSAGLFGMVFGALVFSPIADIVGRRLVLLAALAFITVGMAAGAFSTGFGHLLPWRFVTGLGIGCMFAPVNSMAAEYASQKRKPIAVALNVLGYPLGTTIGGLIAVWMLGPTDTKFLGIPFIPCLGLGWQSIFILGAGLTAALIPLILFFMPESMEFLLSKRPKNALPRINVLMTKLGHAPLAQLPPPDEEAKSAAGLQQILAQPYLSRVITIIASYFVIISAFYFFSGLTPTILAQNGFPASLARLGTIATTIGGMLGSLCFGFLVARIPIRHLTSIVSILALAAMALFGHLAFNVWVLLGGAIVAGFFINSAIAGCYSALAAGFPAHLRSTGSGFALGIGRFGAVVGPLIGGILGDAGIPFVWVYTLVGLPLILSAVFMQVLSLDRERAAPQDDVAGGFIALLSGVVIAALVLVFRPTGFLEEAITRVSSFTIAPLWFYILAAIAAALLASGVFLLVRKKGPSVALA